MTAITFIRALQVVCDLAQQAVTENEDDEQREILAEQNAALERIETAAPAMLAALQLAVSDADSTGCEGCAVISAHTVEAMESAITAATGGTPTDEAGDHDPDQWPGGDLTGRPDPTPTAEPAAPIGEAVGKVAMALWRAKAAKEIAARKAPKKLQPVLDGIKWAAFSIACELRGLDPEFDRAGFMAAAGYPGEF